MKKMRWVGHMEENRNAHRVLKGKPERRRQLRICRWVTNMKIDLKELGQEGMDMITDKSKTLHTRYMRCSCYVCIVAV
jgi:hypothetical protein